MSKGRILVVEDDNDISNMLKIYFSAQGYEVTIAGRGNDALERTRKQLPNVIVLDIMLPDIDGYEVCTRLRRNLRTSHVPIIFLTQKDERSDRIAGLELGADDYITKPFDIEELRLRVQGAMRRAERESLTNPTTGLPSGKMIEEQLRGADAAQGLGPAVRGHRRLWMRSPMSTVLWRAMKYCALRPCCWAKSTIRSAGPMISSATSAAMISC